MWVYWLRSSPPMAAVRAGHDSTMGTEWPPRWAVILYSLKGVLQAMAQPRG